MIRKAITVACLALALAGCEPDEPDTLEPGMFDPGLVDRQRLQCESDGGRWTTSEAIGRSVCVRVPSDANESCSASTDCEGLCLARSRTCAPVTPFFGCHEVLNARGAAQTLCIE